jgi:hypothetical protein
MQQSGPSLAPPMMRRPTLCSMNFQTGASSAETDEADADRETVIADIISGQYKKPVRVIAFNTAEGWARDVTEEIAREIADTYDGEPLSGSARDFVERVSDLVATS